MLPKKSKKGVTFRRKARSCLKSNKCKLYCLYSGGNAKANHIQPFSLKIPIPFSPAAVTIYNGSTFSLLVIKIGRRNSITNCRTEFENGSCVVVSFCANCLNFLLVSEHYPHFSEHQPECSFLACLTSLSMDLLHLYSGCTNDI